eukprot:SAG11_NODE_1141_length_5707_cov_14.979315_7_plen_80_part_00
MVAWNIQEPHVHVHGAHRLPGAVSKPLGVGVNQIHLREVGQGLYSRPMRLPTPRIIGWLFTVSMVLAFAPSGQPLNPCE